MLTKTNTSGPKGGTKGRNAGRFGGLGGILTVQAKKDSSSI